MKNKLAKLTAVTLAASMVIGSSVTGMEEQDPGMYTTVTQSPFMMH